MLDSLHQTSVREHPILGRLGENSIFTADLQIEVNQVAFNLLSEDNRILITTDRATDLRHLGNKAVRSILNDRIPLGVLESVFFRTNHTVYVQNRFIGILGPKANPFLRKLFYWFVGKSS